MTPLPHLPCLLAHFPGAEYVFPPILLIFLIVGAVLPPILLWPASPSPSTGRRWLRIILALTLNLVGLIEYLGMAWMLGAAVFCQADETVFMFSMGCIFLAVEGLVFWQRQRTLNHPRS